MKKEVPVYLRIWFILILALIAPYLGLISPYFMLLWLVAVILIVLRIRYSNTRKNVNSAAVRSSQNGQTSKFVNLYRRRAEIKAEISEAAKHIKEVITRPDDIISDDVVDEPKKEPTKEVILEDGEVVMKFTDIPVSPYELPESPHPLRGWANLGTYVLHGMNPKTGRMNKREILAVSAIDAVKKAKDGGLTAPFIVDEELLMSAPSEPQMDYFRSIGFPDIPSLTTLDVSCFLSKHEDDEPLASVITVEQWREACELGIQVSAVMGQKRYKRIMSYEKEQIETAEAAAERIERWEEARRNAAVNK